MRRLQNKLRTFKLLSLQDEYAFLLASDYCSVIDRLFGEQQASCLPSTELGQTLRFALLCMVC